LGPRVSGFSDSSLPSPGPRAPGRELFDILDLLPHPLELRLHRDDERRHVISGRLGGDGIRLAIHLLNQEVQFAAARFRRFRERLPVCEVAAEPDDFFRDVRARDEADDFLSDDRGIGESARDVADAIGEP
jgi:hypothetical protein